MDSHKKKQETKEFYTVTDFSSAEFLPKSVYNRPDSQPHKKKQGKNILSIISNIIPWSPRKPTRTLREQGASTSQQPSFQAGGTISTCAKSQQQKKIGITHQLRFCTRLNMEHILIGNQNQLDALSISDVQNNNLKSNKLWSINLKNSIDLVTVDVKKFLIAIVSNNLRKLYIYRYNNKYITRNPKVVSFITLHQDVKAIYFIKDNLIICKEFSLDVYTVSNDDTIYKKISTKYAIPDNLKNKITYFCTPPPLDSTLNIFFEESCPAKSTFTLWVHEIQCSVNDVITKGMKKVYDIQKSLKSKIVLKNYLKDTFLMNIGWEILAVKKGYVIDSVSINSALDKPTLRYIGDQKLVLVSQKKLQIYFFTICTDTKPFRIRIKPLDSVQLSMPKYAKFNSILEVYNNNLLLLFEEVKKIQKKPKGQIQYWLTITKHITLKQKYDLFFNGRSLYDINQEQLERYFDMSKKMGITERDMFYQLWNRSDRTPNDFHFLLQTKDHILIRQQLKKLLRKHSLPFTQVYKLHRNALSVMKQQLLKSSDPNREMFMGYIELSYLLRKLQYFRDVMLLQKQIKTQNSSINAPETPKQTNSLVKTPKQISQAPQQNIQSLKSSLTQTQKKQKLMVSIKFYYEINSIHVIDTLVELTQDLIINQKPIQHRIRIFLNIFKFPLRMIYKQALSKIIQTLGKDFSLLIQKIPQILPYQFNEQSKKMMSRGVSQMSNGFFDGIWGHMNTYEKDNAACFDRIVTIDNRHVISQTMKQLSFRRGFMTTHCFIAQPDNKIQQNYNYMQSQQTFYYVIEQTLKYVNHINQRKIIFSLIEQKYYEKLTHLKNRINLYYQLYHYLEMKDIVLEKDGKVLTFNNFLCLRDYEVFSLFFKLQKNRKGLLLSQIKPIYEENSKQGPDLFNECLLQYFKMPISQLSDIKYILNRINNEKRQFHINNQQMYQILVQAMTFKLCVGTDNDIPLKQVLIYIQNVPMNKNNEILSKLNFISNIDQNIEIIRAARVNMSIHQIMENPSQLIGRLCQHLIIQMNVNNQQSSKQILNKSYGILAKLQNLHHQIYHSQQDPLFYILFIYIVKLSVDYQMFPHIKAIINDQFLLKEMECTSNYIADIVGLFLFRSFMAENKLFMGNQKYLRGLISIFDQQSRIRQFIICQFEYAIRLSCEQYKVEYPLSPKYGSPGAAQLQTVIYHLKAEQILNTNIEQLYDIMCTMKITYKDILSNMNNINEDQIDRMNTIIAQTQRPQISRKQIYQQFILRLINLRKIRQVIPYIEQYLKQRESFEQSIIFPFLFLSEISEDLNFQGHKLFFKLSAFYFDQPQKLFNIIKQYMLTPRSMKQRSLYLRQQVNKCQQQNNQEKSFNKMKINKLLNPNLIQIAIKNGLQHNLFNIFEKSYYHIVNSRSQFNHIMFGFVYLMLLNQPYLLTKYIVCSKKIQVIKNIRMFLNFLAKQTCFNPITLMQLGSRVFLTVLISIQDQRQVADVLQQITAFQLTQQLPQQYYQIDYSHQIQYFNRLYRSCKWFSQMKIKKLRKIHSSMDSSLNAQQQQQLSLQYQDQFHKKLLSPSLVMDQKPISCSENDISQFGDQRTYVMDISKKQEFDHKGQMDRLLNKTTSNRKKKRKGSFEHQRPQQFNHQSLNDIVESQPIFTNIDKNKKHATQEIIPQQNIQIDDIAIIQQKNQSLKQESKASENGLKQKSSKKMSEKSGFSQIPVIIVNYKKRQSEQFGDIGGSQIKRSQNQDRQQQPIKKQKPKAKTFREGKTKLKPLSKKFVSKIQQPSVNIDKVLRESSLQKTPPNEQKNIGVFQFKDFFGHPKNIKQASPSEEGTPLLSPNSANTKSKTKQIRQLLKNEFSDTKSIQRDKSRNSIISGKSSSPSRKSSKNIQIITYKRFQGIPIIEELGLKFYRDNLLLIDNPKTKSFKINLLTRYQKKQNFNQYMLQMIKYLYRETSETSLVGLMRLLTFLVDHYKLPIKKANLQIWARAQNLSYKYKLGLNIRQIIPIQLAFDISVSQFKIFYESLPKIKVLLDDINVFKIAKMISLAFQQDQFENQVIYAYLQKIAFSHHLKHAQVEQIDVQNIKETNQQVYQQEKVERLVQKLPVSLINQRFIEMYQNTRADLKDQVLKGMVNKARRSGKQIQKRSVLEMASKIDKTYEQAYHATLRGI